MTIEELKDRLPMLLMLGSCGSVNGVQVITLSKVMKAIEILEKAEGN